MGGKTCSICETWLPLSEFSKNRNSKDGHQIICKTCSVIINRAWNIANAERKWAICTFNAHKRKGITISVTIKELEELAKQIKNCQLCGCKITYGPQRLEGEGIRNKAAPYSASLDRKDVNEPMTIFNIGIICYKCNELKSTFTPKTMKDFLSKFEEYYADRSSFSRRLYNINEEDLELGR